MIRVSQIHFNGARSIQMISKTNILLFPKTSKSTRGKTKSAFGDIYGTYSGDVLSSSAGGFGDDGSAARYFYCPKTSKSERNQGLDDFPTKDKVFNGKSSTPSKDMKGVEQKFTTEPSANVHPTVKPVELMKYLCRLVTPKGGVVLDPFMGSGSTGMAAKDEGFEFIGIEKEKEYFEIAEKRISSYAPLMEFM